MLYWQATFCQDSSTEDKLLKLKKSLIQSTNRVITQSILKNMELGPLEYGSLAQACCENKNVLENTVSFNLSDTDEIAKVSDRP